MKSGDVSIKIVLSDVFGNVVHSAEFIRRDSPKKSHYYWQTLALRYCRYAWMTRKLFVKHVTVSFYF